LENKSFYSKLTFSRNQLYAINSFKINFVKIERKKKHTPICDLSISFFIFNFVDNKKWKKDSEMLKVFTGFYLRDKSDYYLRD